MPVTARLSKAFYDRFGEGPTNELVDWFNAVDATYRADLRELNELNFARFDAKLEQRLAQMESRWDKRFVELEARIEKRFVELEARIDKCFVELEARIDKRFVELEARIDKRFVELEARIERLRTEFRSELHVAIAASDTRLIRWMFMFWTGNLVATAGLIFAVMRLGR